MGGKVRVYGKEGFSKSDLGRIGWVPQAAANLPRHIRITVRELVRLGTMNLQNMFKISDSGRSERLDRALEMVGLVDESVTASFVAYAHTCLLYTSPSPRYQRGSSMK